MDFNKLLLVSFLFLTACNSKETYKEMISSLHKVGEVVEVDEGFYKGCHLKVENIDIRDGALYGYWIYYYGTSNDCPIRGVKASHTR